MLARGGLFGTEATETGFKGGHEFFRTVVCE